MSGFFKAVGKVAGAIATVAAFIPGMQPIAAVAGVVSAAASVGYALTAKPPPARGSLTSVLIQVDAMQPYVMGEGLVGGMERYRVGYGAPLKKVPNPYLGAVHVYSGGGPIDSITPYVDQAPVSAWYSGYLYTDTQLGACPETTALTPYFSGMPDWGSSHKLSGQAAILWNLKFDKDGKRFASGVPQLGAYGKWVKAYDPRLDSTRPGGSGSHRLNNESTWTWTENPALHAGTYAYGRYQNGKRTIGVGIPEDGIDWATLAAWATTCDANGWTIFGAVYEPGDRWANLRDICAAGGGEPIFAAGLLSWRYPAAQTALDTVTAADLMGPCSVTKMAGWRDRINTVVPRYRSPDHNWEMVPASAVSVAAYVTADGEEKKVEWPFNLVKDKDQAAQLARYVLEDRREVQPIVLQLHPRFRTYRPGECLELDLPELGLATDAVILERQFDPVNLTVTMTLIGETPGKHASALGLTGTAPAAPATGMAAQDRDELAYTTGIQSYAENMDGEIVTAQVADSAVTTAKIESDGVTTPWLVTASSAITINSTDTTILTKSVTKKIDESLLEVDAQVPLDGPDAVKVIITFEVRQSGTLIDSRTFTLEVDANGTTVLPFNYTHYFDAIDAGTYDVNLLIRRTTANTCSTSGTYHLRIREFQR